MVKIVFLQLCGLVLLAPRPGLADQRMDILLACARSGERTWRNAQDPPARMGCRELYTYALVLAEAGVQGERIEPLLRRGAEMHDRDPASRSYGNFRWYWNDTKVVDYNAVEFCMQSAVPLWLRHKDKLTGGARDVLRATMELAGQGCLRHRVRPGYTNIALMNAQNLLLLGQALGRPELSKEGGRRLDRVCLDVWQHGVQEYVSPTYYGVNLDCLLLIEALAESPRAVEQARALLRLLWTDIAANWYAPAQRLGGTRSRDYNYLCGAGMLDLNLQLAGWLDSPPSRAPGLVLPLLGRWKPPAQLRELVGKYPRTVRQSWGPREEQTRTHYVLGDVSLSASSACYHNMDMPLTVDIGRGRQMVRGYFIPDGRHDPYGKIKIPEASGHLKTLHLRPFWTAAQDKTDAVGAVVYRPGDIPEGTQTLESHFVLPREVDGVWVAGRRVELAEPGTAAKAEQAFPLAADQALVVRKGTAAMGVKMIFAADEAGRPVQAALVNDGNAYGAMRLTVRHLDRSRAAAGRSLGTAGGKGTAAWGPRACFWVRVAGGLNSDEAFDRWRREFESAAATVRPKNDPSTFTVPSSGGSVSVTIRPPGEPVDATSRRVREEAKSDERGQRGGTPRLQAPHQRPVLEIDGRDVGREIVADIEPIRSWRRAMDGGSAIAVEAGGTAWEAERGAVVGGMEVAPDATASGEQYVWAPPETGPHAAVDGMACFRLSVPRAGRWRLWGRVQAPTPQDDSFFVSVRQGGRVLLDRSDWHVGVHKQWQWTAFAPDKSAPGLDLPAGEVVLEIAPREDGAKLDRLFLALDEKAHPK